MVVQELLRERATLEGNWRTLEPVRICRDALHKRPFRLVHNLASHPLLTREALAEAATEWAARPDVEPGRPNVHMDSGDVAVSDVAFSGPRPKAPAAEVIRHIETANALVLIQHLEAHPAYRPLFDEFVDFVRTLGGPEAESYLPNHNFVVFISSPGRKTAFHIDEEINFLMQAQGVKSVFVCDPLDRRITLEEELERVYCGEVMAAAYKPEAETRAEKFVITPGDAVHIPTHGAHWVQNHDAVSVSVSIYFRFPPSHCADIYKFNRQLRRLGLSPRPPGQSARIDRAKQNVVAATRLARDVLKRS